MEAKLQHHQAFEAEVQANKHRVETATSNGQELMAQKHFASDKIRQTITLTSHDAYAHLLSPSLLRRDVCAELQEIWRQLESGATDKGAIAHSDIMNATSYFPHRREATASTRSATVQQVTQC